MLYIKKFKQRNGRLLPLARDLAAIAKTTNVTEESVYLLTANVKKKTGNASGKAGESSDESGRDYIYKLKRQAPCCYR